MASSAAGVRVPQQFPISESWRLFCNVQMVDTCQTIQGHFPSLTPGVLDGLNTLTPLNCSSHPDTLLSRVPPLCVASAASTVTLFPTLPEKVEISYHMCAHVCRRHNPIRYNAVSLFKLVSKCLVSGCLTPNSISNIVVGANHCYYRYAHNIDNFARIESSAVVNVCLGYFKVFVK